MLSLIIPLYNEENIVEDFVREIEFDLDKVDCQFEIILVDDGSIDNTLNIIQKLEKEIDNVKAISHPINHGKGYAIRQGFQLVSGEYVMFIDGDRNIPSNIIMEYVEALKDADLVIADKFHPRSIVNVPILRRVLSRGFSLIVSILFRLEVLDTQTGIKAGRVQSLAQIIRKMRINRFAFDVELILLAKIYGLKIITLPVALTIQENYVRLGQILNMSKDLLKIYYYYIKKMY